MHDFATFLSTPTNHITKFALGLLPFCSRDSPFLPAGEQVSKGYGFKAWQEREMVDTFAATTPESAIGGLQSRGDNHCIFSNQVVVFITQIYYLMNKQACLTAVKG